MVNGAFTLFAAFPAHIGKGGEAPFDTRNLVAKLPSRGEPCNQIGPPKTAEIRGIRSLGNVRPVELPLEHALVDNATW